MKSSTCCFIGHRKLPADKVEGMLLRLNREVDALIQRGVTVFLSGGAMGFDLIAASLVIAKREMGAKVRLIFALPCKNQDEKWPAEQGKLYRSLLAEADEIRYVSQEYGPECMKRRDQYLIDHSAFCICALLRNVSGTGQTVRIAWKAGLWMVNVIG